MTALAGALNHRLGKNVTRPARPGKEVELSHLPFDNHVGPSLCSRVSQIIPLEGSFPETGRLATNLAPGFQDRFPVRLADHSAVTWRV